MSTRLFNQKAVVAGLIFTSGAVITAGCGAHTSAAPPSAPAVDVATVEQRDVPQYREWVGTLDGMVNAAIKAQVNGYLLSQNYAEGSFVKQGQLLFQIDARPFQAALDQAQGQLAQANAQASQARAQLLLSQAQLGTTEANQHKAQLDEDRYAPLAKQQAVTQQDLDNATQTNVAAKAQVEAAKAQVEASRAQTEAATAAIQAATANVQAAKVNLEFTRLTSPISGVAGMAQMQVGSLVGPSGGPVTTVSTLDPIKVNFTVGEQEYLAFSRGAVERMLLELILSDGTVYAHKGKFSFADRQVNPATGAIQLTGLFPNPGNVLRPGQYGRVRAVTGTTVGALLVPQRSVTEMQGTYQVAVVDPNNTVRLAKVDVGDRTGSQWIVTNGLKPGERVITEGVLKVRPGMPVTPQQSAQAAGGGGN